MPFTFEKAPLPGICDLLLIDPYRASWSRTAAQPSAGVVFTLLALPSTRRRLPIPRTAYGAGVTIMRVTAKEMVAGHPVLEVRRMFRRVAEAMSVDLVGKLLNIEEKTATSLGAALEADGYVERHRGKGHRCRDCVATHACRPEGSGGRGPGRRLTITRNQRVIATCNE